MVHQHQHEHHRQSRNEVACRVSQLITLMDHDHSAKQFIIYLVEDTMWCDQESLCIGVRKKYKVFHCSFISLKFFDHKLFKGYMTVLKDT
jgi:hypothetical protein